MQNTKQVNQQLLTRLSESTALADRAIRENKQLTERRNYAFAHADKLRGIVEDLSEQNVALLKECNELREGQNVDLVDVCRNLRAENSQAKTINLALLQLLNRAADLLPAERAFLDEYHAVLEQSLALYEPQTNNADVVDNQPV